MTSLMSLMEDVRVERLRQDAKWGPDRILPSFEWLAILEEEVGEAAEASLLRDNLGMRVELIQIAAVALAWVDAIDRGASIHIDTQLVAAAPDLLEALQSLLDWSSREYQSSPRIDAQARAAIEKAKSKR